MDPANVVAIRYSFSVCANGSKAFLNLDKKLAGTNDISRADLASTTSLLAHDVRLAERVSSVEKGKYEAEDEAGVNGSKLITGIRGSRKRKVPPTKITGRIPSQESSRAPALQTEKRSETASSSSERMPRQTFLSR